MYARALRPQALQTPPLLRRRAAPAIETATNAWAADPASCALPCEGSGTPGTGVVEGGCCDGVWLPHIEIPNLTGLNQVLPGGWGLAGG
jgi:hypothetical protein